MTFKELLSSLGLRPKSLDAATATLDTAKSQLEAVNALFTAAGLNLETMLAGGPDALKLHCENLSASDAELAKAQGQIQTLEANVADASAAHAKAIEAKDAQLASANAELANANVALSGIGFNAKVDKPEDAKKAFNAHVQKAANVELAKTGHPQIGELPPAKDPAKNTEGLTGRDLYKADFERQLAAKAKR